MTRFLEKSFSVSLSSPEFGANYDRIFKKKTPKKPKPKKKAAK